MTSRPETWPQAIDELLPHTLFSLAANYPDLTYSEYPKDSLDISQGYRNITYREVANAVNALAWWIEKNVGKPKTDDGRETVVYMGPNDLRYGILVLGSIMIGYKPLFPTPRYGAEGLNSLIAAANGSIMLTPASPFPVVAEVLAIRDMRTFEIPTLEALLAAEPERYPYTKTFAAHKHEPFICLHTSGTTGFPKPVIWTHEWANSAAKGHYLPTPEGYERMDGRMHGPKARVMFMFPSFHASGFSGMLFFPLFTGSVVVYPPFAPDPKGQIDGLVAALDILGEEGKVDMIAMPPPQAEYLASQPELLSRVVSKVKSILWAGGDISVTAGTTISAQIDLWDDLGSTELGPFPAVRNLKYAWSKENAGQYWPYMQFHPAMNIRYDPVSESVEGTLYEAIMVRNGAAENGGWVQPNFRIYADVSEISLGDLFTRHPTEAGLWKYYGRSDELLNIITGEKFHPGTAERRVAAHPGVAEAMWVGTRRPRCALIVRLEEGATVEGIWPTVEKVSRDSGVVASVRRDMILVVDEPFLKTAKGSMQKKAMLDLYENKLNVLYAGEDSKGTAKS